MILAKTSEVRNNISEYFSKAFAGEEVIVDRPRNEHVAVISLERLNQLKEIERKQAYIEDLELSLRQLGLGQYKEVELED